MKLNNFLRFLFWGCNDLVYREKQQYYLCDRFVLLSETFKEDFIKRTHIKNASKLRWIPDPLSFPLLPVNRNVQKQKQVLIISRLYERQKNLTAALRIWKEIELRGNDGWQLVLCGYGPDEKKILKYAKKLGLRRMRFDGKVENPIKWYEDSSIFMMTSNYEGFGMTLTEALQFGCIPIAFDNYTALHDILKDGYNGFIVPSREEQMYVTKLNELMNNHHLLKQMSQQAKKSSSKFSIEMVGQKWLELINELQ